MLSPSDSFEARASVLQADRIRRVNAALLQFEKVVQQESTGVYSETIGNCLSEIPRYIDLLREDTGLRKIVEQVGP